MIVPTGDVWLGSIASNTYGPGPPRAAAYRDINNGLSRVYKVYDNTTAASAMEYIVRELSEETSSNVWPCE